MTTRRASGTSGHAATSRSTPLETMSLPMKQTWRSWTRSSRRRALAAAPASRAKAPSPTVVLAGAQPLDQGRRRRRRRRRAGGTRRRRRPAGPSRVRCGQAVVLHRREQRLAGVARADEDRPRARQALARPGQEARGVALDDVLQGAAVHLHRVGHVAAQPAGEDRRPHDEVVGERHVGPGARADVAHGGDVGLARRPRSRRRCTPAACAPRTPRSGRRRRRAAGGRCPAATPSRAPARAAS